MLTLTKRLPLRKRGTKLNNEQVHLVSLLPHNQIAKRPDITLLSHVFSLMFPTFPLCLSLQPVASSLLIFSSLA